jgi:hypothetical protein
MKYLINTSMIALGLAMSNPTLAQTVCVQNGTSIVCNNGLTGNRIRNTIIWNDRTSQTITPSASGGVHGPVIPDSSPYYPANPTYGVPAGIYGRTSPGNGMYGQ